MVDELWPAPDHNDDERELDRLEPSWADFMHGLRTGVRFVRDGIPDHMRHKTLVEVRLQFDAFRARYQEGDEPALIGALCYALEEGVPAPYWLARDVVTRIKRVQTEAVSLRDAFGLAARFPTKGKKAANARAQLKQRGLLWHLTAALMHAEGLRLDPALRRVLAANSFAFSLTVARRLFNEQDHIQRLHLGKTPSTTGAQALSRKRPTFRKP